MRVLLFQRYASYRFIADFAEDFRAAGHAAEWLPPTEGPRLPAHVQRFLPDCIFCVGASPAVAKAVAGRVPVVFYELDKILNHSLWEGAPTSDRDVVFTTYRDDVAVFRGFGFRHVHYLPFCPNIARTPASDGPAPAPEFGLSFVGSIVRERTNDYRTLLDHGHTALANDAGRLALFGTLVGFLERILADQELHLPENEYRIPAGLRSPPPEAARAMDAFRLPAPVLAGVLAKEAAYRQRRFWLTRSGTLDFWGPESSDTLVPGLRYHGPADQYTASGPIFARSLASFNLQRLYAQDGLSDRVFNVLAAGGCLLADANPSLLELFEPGHELETFASPEELREKTDRLRAEPEHRRRLAEQGLRCVQARHLFRHRLTEMLLRLPGTARTNRRSAATPPAPSPALSGPPPGVGCLPQVPSEAVPIGIKLH